MKSLIKIGKRLYHKADSYVKCSLLFFPKRIQCNICGWSGRRFLNEVWHRHAVCPKCASGIRHRLLIAALSRHPVLCFQNLVGGKDILHFAPEPFNKPFFQSCARRYVTADFLKTDCDMILDISNMPQIKPREFDLLVASDVLEHVEDDRRAMREIHRVLRTNGYAILTVPQKDHLTEIFEDKTVTDPTERERLFGQSDHLRIYGNNFPKILESVGFKVTAINELNFPEEVAKRNVLFPPFLCANPLATNFRKIFFAQKA